MVANVENQNVNALQKIVSALSSLGDDEKARVLNSVLTLLGISLVAVGNFKSSGNHRSSEERISPAPSAPGIFSEDRSPSPKEFLAMKEPKTDVERVACLAYYLAHYRSQPHFKTLDLSQLNTEAAQRKFSNTAVAVMNSARAGFLVPGIKGHRQLSHDGERFVNALPNRDAAKNVFSVKPRKKVRKAMPSK